MIKSYQIPGDQTAVQIGTIIIVLTSLGWMVPARLVRGQFLSLIGRDYVTAARALGAANRRIMLRHLLPNSMAPLIVYATLAVGEYVIVESALSFLGLGISPPTPSWGNMLSAFQTYMRIMPIVAIYPGACIFLTVISINFLGDGLRDALDPWLRNR
jgi:peptide/nickel transport system permease protein